MEAAELISILEHIEPRARVCMVVEGDMPLYDVDTVHTTGEPQTVVVLKSEPPKRKRHVKSSVTTADGQVWPIAQTPNEVEVMIRQAEGEFREFVEFDIGELECGHWRGRSVKLRHQAITAIAPPIAADEVHSDIFRD